VTPLLLPGYAEAIETGQIGFQAIETTRITKSLLLQVFSPVKLTAPARGGPRRNPP